MKLFDKISAWLGWSNHFLHERVGGILMLLITLFAYCLTDCTFVQSILIGTLTTFIAMLSVEVKDLMYGNKLDWSDILAGMVWPLVSWGFVLLYHIVNFIIKLF